ncbi:hypothetical protein T4C_12709 [Trichinella pseudospiralis]|uniref:Uncharacterized protein n=1 Tax=Trichinella pseudospiralis TaxID=6337 RepID=A0A0V1K3Q2_TRIPS|nr:hypothetical protein T4C_12709 [Trichinella pseudospiralis]
MLSGNWRMYKHITTLRYLEIVKIKMMEYLKIFTSICDGMRKMSKWCMALKTNDVHAAVFVNICFEQQVTCNLKRWASIVIVYIMYVRTSLSYNCKNKRLKSIVGCYENISSLFMVAPRAATRTELPRYSGYEKHRNLPVIFWFSSPYKQLFQWFECPRRFMVHRTYKLLIQWFFLCPGQLMVKFGVYSAATLPDNIYADYIATVTDQLGTKSLPADCVDQGSALSKYTSLESGKPQKPDSLRQRPPAQPKGTKKFAYANLTQPGGKYCAIICQGHSPKRYANFFMPWGVAAGDASG